MKEPLAEYHVAHGLGNIIQTTPAFSYLKSVYERVIVCTDYRYEHFVRAVYLGHEVHVRNHGERLKSADYYESVNPSVFRSGNRISEAEANLFKVGAIRGQCKRGFCGFEATDEQYDVLICDGYNKRITPDGWEVKSYPHWEVIASILIEHGFSVASIGLPGEHVPGTIDKTGIGLLPTLGLIQRARVLASNDTGFYHAANTLKTRNVVVFTMTDRHKNYDPEFHKYSTLMHTNLDCQPCQLDGKALWLSRKDHCKWACRNVPASEVLLAIESHL